MVSFKLPLSSIFTRSLEQSSEVQYDKSDRAVDHSKEENL